jgi:hypothetical protein
VDVVDDVDGPLPADLAGERSLVEPTDVAAVVTDDVIVLAVLAGEGFVSVASLPHGANAVDRGRNIKGGFTGQGERLTADQDQKGKKKPATTTKKKKDQ